MAAHGGFNNLIMYNVNPGIMASIAGGAALSTKLIDIINRLGLSTGLQVCLDVGDADSYPGTGQTWSDLSGNNNDFWLGDTVSVEATDPVFTGTAGVQSESTYWDINSTTDKFTETTAQAWAEPVHKNNGAITVIHVTYPVTSAAIRGILTTGNILTTGGFATYLSTGLAIRVRHTTGLSFVDEAASTFFGTASVWNFIGVAYDEATTNMKYRINGSGESITTTASTGTVASGTNLLLSYSITGSAVNATVGDRVMCTAMWDRQLTDAEMQSIYNALKPRLPSMP